MAPGVLATESVRSDNAIPRWEKTPNDQAPRSIFPDGVRTSGQHEPLFDLIRPYSEFPRKITGPTVWKREDYDDNNTGRWTHIFTDDEIKELGETAEQFIERNIPLTGISKSNFPLPRLSKRLEDLRNDLINGKGFILFKNFPANEWGTLKSAVAYMGLGTYFGYFLSQNGRGHVLGHVKDTGEDATQIDKVRIYRTTARQYFHTDDGDIVGLLCLHRAAEGGESDIVSSHHVWNTLQKEHPDVAELLTKPIWYFDRKGEVSDGQKPYIRAAVFYLERPTEGREPRVYAKWDPYFIRSMWRFWEAGTVPRLSDEQDRAMRILEDTCYRLALHMVLEVGDIQFLSNAHVLHARTAYKDYPPPAPRRHLLRLWLSTPEDEGGWSLPMPDAKEKKRGGIQVNDTAPRAPLDAE
ncbi:uncharacterized protein PV09_05875 [Verruconis gallopava]|uniref:TauD/TfdA-like domain-containing protein n=1 Tax=Verruconis gallopava TaxID=253628 RepID=A0A0D1YQC4_9PEZI|nr:uncharacterized protein PV09_05875 [Verruconis gallopava]KIW02817.1 hypothetical protein PV09_05875 [Verruconis gallopava]